MLFRVVTKYKYKTNSVIIHLFYSHFSMQWKY